MTSEIFWSERSTSRSTGDRIQARHFISRNIDPDDSVTGYMTDSVFVWNLDSGRLVRTIKTSNISSRDVDFLSSDASLLIVKVGKAITSFCSRTGVHLAAAGYELGDAVPIRRGNGLFHTSDGFIRNGVDLAPIYSSNKLTESSKVLSVSKEGESFKALEFSVKDNKEIAGRSLHLVITDLTQQDKTRATALDMLRRSLTMEATFSPKDRSLIVQADRRV
ncbi:hypothetical protein EDD11_008220 [Mortierella claussenii]|nr:hypothetical protein EDD11_008220 [Mortierella claussenii]